MEKLDSLSTTGTLPQPTTAPKSYKSRARIVRRAIIFGSIALVAVHQFGRTSSRSSAYSYYDNDSTQDVAAVVDIDPVEAYWNGVATRGLRSVLPGAVDPMSASSSAAQSHPFKHKKWISPKRAEHIYLSVPTNDSAAAASTRYTSHAHPAGSGWDLITALTVKNDWERELGIPVSGPEEFIYDAGSSESQSRIKDGMGKLGVWIDTYYPVMNTPVSSSVTLLSDPPVSAKLRESYVPGDEGSVLADEVRVFHGLSVSGDVTGKYVYAGYGRKADFDLLQAKGIDFTGTIAIVKYGAVFRGLKVKAAQEAGAIGCIIYTDPADDGIYTEANGYEQYPKGPARVRGSVQFLSMYPGDPTTPGEPAYKNASRIEGGNFPSIPSLPMSFEDVIPILKALKGQGLAASDLDPSFEGGLGYYGVEYFSGPSELDLRLVNEVNTRVMPIWNTMAVIPGHIQDEVIVMGNHRDAWVLGGSDPNAGTASQYELVRGLGKLIKKGWKPLRSIVLASWDAEEYGLIGSTEWAEDFGSWLEENAAAYLNLDSSASGQNFKASASPSLANLVRGAAEEVEKGADPSRSVWDARADGGDWDEFRATTYGIIQKDDESTALVTEAAGGSGVSALGSGSDYTAFLMHYGVASTDFSFGGGPKDPVYHYHSIYDSHTWQALYGDPGFHKHTEGAKIIGLIVLRLADSLILPINTTQYALDLGYYLQKIDKLKDGSDDYASLDLAALASAIDQLTAASAQLDVTRQELLERLRDVLPEHPARSFLRKVARTVAHKVATPLARAFGFGTTDGCSRAAAAATRMDLWAEPSIETRLARAGLAFDADADAEKLHSVALPKLPLPHLPKIPSIPSIGKLKAILAEIRKVNVKLRDFESGFISQEGITDREWYKHKGTSPGKWLGYGATTFPALTEALTIEKSVGLAQTEANELAEMIGAMAKRLLA